MAAALQTTPRSSSSRAGDRTTPALAAYAFMQASSRPEV